MEKFHTRLLNDKIKETLRKRNNLTKNYRIVSGLEATLLHGSKRKLLNIP